MTSGRDNDGRDVRAESGVALRLPDGEAILPVSPAGCIALARAVLVGDDDAAAAWRRAASHDPAVAAWLLACRGIPGALADSIPTPDDLRRSLVSVGRAAGAGPPTDEADLLQAAAAAAAARHELEERFTDRVAEARLDALKELAYGAGHEINNPLANIAARGQALLADEEDPERRRRLAAIVDQAFRARDMIGGLMLFARPPRPQPTEVGLDELVRPVVESLMPQAAARGVRLAYSAAPRPLFARIDAAQVGEALRMLAVNAVEAVADGGRVQLETDGVEGGSVRVMVGDDGPGMDAETAARAADPFFSGREAGRGIGLGLPKAVRLIEASGGRLAIESRPGKGTRCTVTLPAAETPAERAAEGGKVSPGFPS